MTAWVAGWAPGSRQCRHSLSCVLRSCDFSWPVSQRLRASVKFSQYQEVSLRAEFACPSHRSQRSPIPATSGTWRTAPSSVRTSALGARWQGVRHQRQRPVPVQRWQSHGWRPERRVRPDLALANQAHQRPVTPTTGRASSSTTLTLTAPAATIRCPPISLSLLRQPMQRSPGSRLVMVALVILPPGAGG